MLDEPTDFCRLFLFRHPELEARHHERAVGAGPAEIGRRGRAQVAAWLAWTEGVQLAEVHCSSQPQCHEPARALAERFGVEPKPNSRLRDQEMGSWQGEVWSGLVQREPDAVRQFFAQFGEARPPGGESLGEAVTRALEWWGETAPHLLGKTIAVVMPGSLLAAFASTMLGIRLSRSVSLNLPHGGLGVLDVFQNGARITCWNPGALE